MAIAQVSGAVARALRLTARVGAGLGKGLSACQGSACCAETGAAADASKAQASSSAQAARESRFWSCCLATGMHILHAFVA